MSETPTDDTWSSDSGADSGAPRYQAAETEALLRQAIQVVEEARPMPLSASSMINKEELLAVLNQAADGLPDELRSARWLLKERDDFLARVQGEGDEIIARARARAEQMVQRTELVKAAEERARTVVADAEERAKNLRLETEDWCDQKLGGMEVVLERTMRTVASGRARLQGAAPKALPDEPVPVVPEPVSEDPVFDQEL